MIIGAMSPWLAACCGAVILALLSGNPAAAAEIAKPVAVPEGKAKEASKSYLEGLIARAHRYLDGKDVPRNPAKAASLLRAAVRAGDLTSMFLLAELYATGDGVPVNFDRARQLLEGAVAAGEVQEGSRALGDLYRSATGEHRNPAKAEANYQKAIELGDGWAMIALADMVSAGGGVPVDFNRARTLLEAAIAAGREKEASRALGDLYRGAEPPHRDAMKAEAAYQRAADLGDAGAMIALSQMLGRGEGIPADFDRAQKLLERVAAVGREKEALRALGDLYRLADPAYRDPKKAEAAYQRSADLGDAGAMIALSQMLRGGEGLPVDFKRARTLLNTAIATGREKDGLRALGDLYRRADPPHRDPVKAEAAYGKAAALGDTGAMLSLAHMLAKGDGIPVDFARARTLFEAAAADEPIEASRSLGDLYRFGSGEQRDLAKAEAAYQKAVDLGDAEAMISLAEMVSTGEGVEVNFDRARHLLERAVQVGEVQGGSRALGDLYRNAAPERRDPGKAQANYERAIELGDAWAMIALAEMLGNGEGVTADFDHALTLLDAAIAAGREKEASRALGNLYRLAEPPHRDASKAQVAYQRAADLGDAGAMIALSQMLARGEGLPVDFDRSRALLIATIAAGREREGSRALGDFYRRAEPPYRDASKAEAAYQRAVDLGDAGAMIALSQMLAKGEGIPADFERARTLLNAAILAGEIEEGSRALGDLYRRAEAPHRDAAKAEAAYQRAIDLGNAEALIALARMLANGDGIPVDFDHARTLLETAAATAPIEASRALGDLYRYAAPANRDAAKAEAAYQKAVALGDAEAMLALADMISTADGIAFDFDRARQLLEEAVTAGEVQTGSLALGDLYRYAPGSLRDAAKAEAHYQRATELGDGWAMIALADMASSGDGIPVDLDRARTLLEAGVAAGREKEAAKKLGDLYLAMARPDTRKARASYERAASAGNPKANLAVALLLVEEFQNRESREKAIDHLKVAAQTLGAEEIAGAMMHMDSQALVAAVQQFLRSSGYQGPIDGVHGSRTEAAIGEYCREKEIHECEGTFISFDLLVSLLSSSG